MYRQREVPHNEMYFAIADYLSYMIPLEDLTEQVKLHQIEDYSLYDISMTRSVTGQYENFLSPLIHGLKDTEAEHQELLTRFIEEGFIDPTVSMSGHSPRDEYSTDDSHPYFTADTIADVFTRENKYNLVRTLYTHAPGTIALMQNPSDLYALAAANGDMEMMEDLESYIKTETPVSYHVIDYEDGVDLNISNYDDTRHPLTKYIETATHLNPDILNRMASTFPITDPDQEYTVLETLIAREARSYNNASLDDSGRHQLDVENCQDAYNILLDAGLSDRVINRKGENLLHAAAKHNSGEKRFQSLITKVIDPNRVTNDGKSPLSYAIANKNHRAGEMLIAFGAELNYDLDNKKNRHSTPIFQAAFVHNWDFVERALGNTDIVKNAEVIDILMRHAINTTNPAAVEMLLQSGANPNHESARGTTTGLYFAKRFVDPENAKNTGPMSAIASHLIKYGTDFEIFDQRGETALHILNKTEEGTAQRDIRDDIVVATNRRDLVKVYGKEGADQWIKDNPVDARDRTLTESYLDSLKNVKEKSDQVEFKEGIAVFFKTLKENQDLLKYGVGLVVGAKLFDMPALEDPTTWAVGAVGALVYNYATMDVQDREKMKSALKTVVVMAKDALVTAAEGVRDKIKGTIQVVKDFLNYSEKKAEVAQRAYHLSNWQSTVQLLEKPHYKEILTHASTEFVDKHGDMVADLIAGKDLTTHHKYSNERIAAFVSDLSFEAKQQMLAGYAAENSVTSTPVNEPNSSLTNVTNDDDRQAARDKIQSMLNRQRDSFDMSL